MAVAALGARPQRRVAGGLRAWPPAGGAWPATRAAAPSTSTAWSPTTSSSPATWPAFPHPLFDYQFLALEHWGNAVAQAEVAAHNMVSSQAGRWPHLALPVFWSTQFGTDIKSVGVPTFADEVMITQGSVAERRFVAAYGRRGRITAAVTFNQANGWSSTGRLIEQAAPFPPAFRTVDQPADAHPCRPDSPTEPIRDPGRHRRGDRPRPQRAARHG